MKFVLLRKPVICLFSSNPSTYSAIITASSNLFRSFRSTGDSVFSLTNVTKSNFDSVFSDLRSIIRDSDFVSFDLEMTGITSAPWRDSFEFDDVSVRYLKVKDSAEKFAVLQFGICPFRWDQSSECFIAHPYNFYIFPREDNLVKVSSEFLCQTTSIDFLAKYQFDFNMCIYEGVSYISRVQENKALKQLSAAHGDELNLMWHCMDDSDDMLLAQIVDVLFVERIRRIMNEWCSEVLHCGKDISKFQNNYKQFETIVYKLRPAFLLREFTAHELRLIKLETKKHFPDLIYICTGGSSCPLHIVVYTASIDDRSILMKEVSDEIYRDAVLQIENAVGFRKVIDLLSSEKKLIVGHNCFLDIAHICHKFLGNLPSTTEEFALLVKKHFPHIIDTKLILNANSGLQKLMKRGNTSLSNAFSVLCPQLGFELECSSTTVKSRIKVEVCIDDKRSHKWISGAKHEAGYDAFMTGCVFAEACSHLGVHFKNNIELKHMEELKCHMNRLFLSWANGGTMDLTTGITVAETSIGKHKVLTRNVVFLWGVPPTMKTRDMKMFIERALGTSSVSLISYLDETTMFVQFSREELVSVFITTVEQVRNETNLVYALHPFSALFEYNNFGYARYEVYTEMCSSSLSEFFFSDQARAVSSLHSASLDCNT